LEKSLANLWSRKRITKKPHAGRGLETNWEMSMKWLAFKSQQQKKSIAKMRGKGVFAFS
jgi:hypothetical protein